MSEMFDFDQVIDRKNTNCAKWDGMKRKNVNPDVISMWVADMDFKAPQRVLDVLKERIDHGVFGYSFVGDDYLDAIVSWMHRRHQFDIDKQWIVPTPGVVTALKLAVNTLTQKGDGIIIHKPVYYPFDRSILANERHVVENPLIFKDGQYECDFEAFEKAIIENNVKLFILCNPHNPIGKVWKKEELYQLGMICKKHGVKVVADEIHQDFVYEDNEHIPFYNVDPSFKEFSIICTAPSKSFNLAGLQTSNIIIANKEIREAFKATMNRVGVDEPAILGLLACQTAYNECELWFDEMLEYVYDNFTYLDKFLKANMPEIKLVHPQGLYLAWVDFRALNMSAKELEDFMQNKAGLWLDEGYIFGTGGEGFERFNLATPRATLEKACQRLLKAYQELK
ncbi:MULTISPECIES: MalY/PatB family protein [Coprobacillaceae]|uniref:MalY/PatB family protein n=1 Tax=Coprobacillaceae TaxID=2810280 RepID=UPI001F1FA912|nr:MULTISPECIES: MalY/PatB family protein [Coprobacillaceae]